MDGNYPHNRSAWHNRMALPQKANLLLLTLIGASTPHASTAAAAAACASRGKAEHTWSIHPNVKDVCISISIYFEVSIYIHGDTVNTPVLLL